MKKPSNFMLSGIALILFSCADKSNNHNLINTKASLPPSFEFIHSDLKAIATFINKKQQTMSMLYGNSLALNTAKMGQNTIPDGEVLALITWQQQADENWYGAKIPGNIVSIEVVKTKHGEGEHTYSNYQRYDGTSLRPNTNTTFCQARITYILSIKPTVMP